MGLGMKRKAYILGVVVTLASIVWAPVAFAATFGRTTDYTTACVVSSGADGKTSILATLTENGTVSKITANVAGSASLVAKAVIYSENPADTPDALLATSQEVSVTSGVFSWVDFTFTTPVALTSGDYFLGIIGNSNGGSTVQIHCQDVDAGINRFNLDTYSDGPANPFGTPSTSVNEKSIYATYTADSASPAASGFVRTASVQVRSGSVNIR